MAKIKGVKWSQILTLLANIASTLENDYAKKSDFSNPRFESDTLVFPAQNGASFDGDTLVLTE